MWRGSIFSIEACKFTGNELYHKGFSLHKGSEIYDLNLYTLFMTLI